MPSCSLRDPPCLRHEAANQTRWRYASGLRSRTDGRHAPASGMRRLNRTDLRVGVPLPWSCYDRNGHLLLRKGVVVSFEHQIDRLVAEGLFIEDRGGVAASPTQRGEPESVFERLVALAWSLRKVFNDLLSETPAPDAEERLRARARKIIDACGADPNAAIAAIHLDFQNPYMLSHHVHSAVACALLGKRIGVADADLVPIACAALTFDLGLADLAHLEKQAEPLDDEQRRVVNQHVQRTVHILERAGIDDPVWLDSILQHHERWNGSGYPDGLAREDICVGARLLAVADSYTAMIRARAHRPARTPLEAQGELFKGMGVRYDERICTALVKELGIYPPGSIVRLANREIAVVREYSTKEGKALAMSVYDANGLPFLAPQKRDIADPRYAIIRPVPMAEVRAAAVIIRRLWL